MRYTVLSEDFGLGFKGGGYFVRRIAFFLGLFLMDCSLASPPVVDNSPSAIEARLIPPGAAQVAIDHSAAPLPAVAAVGGAAQSPGQKIYASSCAVCHASGVAGAPKVGDKAAWKPRLAQGWEVVLNHALNGYKAMPAKGTCVTCTADDLKVAIEFMTQ